MYPVPMSRLTIHSLLVGCFNWLPVKKKKILFLCYYGSQYGCNPKYLSEYIVQNHPEWDVVWGFTQPARHQIKGVRKVRYMSWRFFYEICTCRVFVTNYRMPTFYRRRKEQLYIQTWHSSLRLKAIENDAKDSVPKHYMEMARHDSQQISALLSGCQKSTDIFKQALGFDGLIAPTGTPRIDILLKDDSIQKTFLKQQLGLHKSCHVVLYAPTFRENHRLEAYNLDLEVLNKCLHIKWGGEWKVLLRLHPHLLNVSLEGRFKSAIDVTAYDDIQELLCVSDIVISDYSGLVFDFAYTRRPCFLFVPDLEDYQKKERQLYFQLDELPFPQIHGNDQLYDVINQFDEQKYHTDIDFFLKQIGSFETGHACESVYKLILSQLAL